MTTDNLYPFLILLMLSGVSLALGRSTVLLANRVRPVRFALSLLVEGLVFVLGALFWALYIYAVLNVVLDVPASFVMVILLVAASYTPCLLGFLVFLPYLGPIWQMILRLLVFFTLLVLVGATFDLSFWAALLTCGLGGLILELLARIPVFNTSTWQENLLRWTTGKAELFTAAELADQLAAEARLQNSPPGSAS